MIQRQGDLRPTARGCLAHPWFHQTLEAAGAAAGAGAAAAVDKYLMS